MATTQLTGFEKLTAEEIIRFMAKNSAAAFQLHAIGITSVMQMLHDAQAELDRRAE